MIEKYLLEQGYIESVTKLEQETTISLESWYFLLLIKKLRDVADNIDLYMILCEYEQFYDYKFGRPPKLTKKLDEKQILPHHKKPPSSRNRGSAKNIPPSSADPQKKLPSISKIGKDGKEVKEGNGDLDLGVEGKNIDTGKKKDKKETDEDYFENRVMKGIPDFYGEANELRP